MHPATAQILRFFEYDHLPEGEGREISYQFHNLAVGLADNLPEDPETTIALRKLLEAKDASVRAALVGEGVITSYEPQNDR